MAIRLGSGKSPGRPKKPTTALVPAASRQNPALTPIESTLNGEAIEMFARVVGGREQLADVLAVASTAPEVEKVAAFLLDDNYRSMSLRRLCGFAGITVADLFTAYKKAMIARSQIEATHIIASKLAPIVTDVMDKALSDPTVERHKLALELGQLVEKKSGIVMQQNTIAASALTATGNGSLEQLHQAVGDLLYSPQRRRRTAPPDIEAIGDPPLEDLPRTDPREPPWPMPTPDPDPEPEEPDDDDEDGDRVGRPGR